MSQREKLLQRISNNQNNVTFRDLKHLLELYGFTVRKPNSGSHYMVYGPGDDFPDKPIPDHHEVKSYLVRDALRWIRQSERED